MLAFLVPLDSQDPAATLALLRSEVESYSPALAEKPFVVVLTKRDLLAERDGIPAVEAPEALGVLPISSASGSGLEDLKEFLWRTVGQVKTAAPEEELPLSEEEIDFE
jgi:GTP-binding protein